MCIDALRNPSDPKLCQHLEDATDAWLYCPICDRALCKSCALGWQPEQQVEQIVAAAKAGSPHLSNFL